MSEVNVYPETIPLIEHARSTSLRRFNQPIVHHNCLGELLAERAARTPDKNWLTFYDDTGQTSAWTYAEFSEQACRTAAFMKDALGLHKGDRIATLAMNDPRTVLVYYGAWLLGLTVVPLNCGEDDDRLAYILENSNARVVFTQTEQLSRCRTFLDRLPGIAHLVLYNILDTDESEKLHSLDKALAQTPPLADLPALPRDTECLIVYTSGTTGAPKGVVLEHANLLADADSITEWHSFGPDDRAMCILPIHHVNGTIVTLVTPLYAGGSVVLHRRFRAQSFWKTLVEEGCTWCSVVPTILAFLCESRADLTEYDLSRFRHIICGAGPLSVELARRFDDAFGVRVVHGYGLSETTCYSCFLPVDLEPPAYHHWMMECGFPSIGCPIPANEMAIHDAEGHPQPPDTRGEIVIRGHNVMRYYFQRPDANADTFKHGWFRSGDEGFFRIGEDGRQYYFITGRIKELIIRGGVNYSPFDIDEVLSHIPGVKAAMCVGFENEFYGEEIGAYVQREAGIELSEDDVLRACRIELPFSKCPKVVVFGDSFPVTSTGKYQRNKLKPLFAEWKNMQFREAKRG
jgi:long-chain acyl-CoA synthetase